MYRVKFTRDVTARLHDGQVGLVTTVVEIPEGHEFDMDTPPVSLGKPWKDARLDMGGSLTIIVPVDSIELKEVFE